MTHPRSEQAVRQSVLSRRRVLGLSALGAAGAVAVPFGAGAGPSAARTPLRFGVVADCQYADAATNGTRHYRDSVRKLREAVATFNDADLDFALHLGDFVDRAGSFDAVVPVFERLRMSRFHVLGNHDYQLPLGELLQTLRMPAPYHHFLRDGWRFVVVDTNDVSLYANPEGSGKHALARTMLDRLTAAGAANAKPWNGAVGTAQLAWLRRVLDGGRTPTRRCASSATASRSTASAVSRTASSRSAAALRGSSRRHAEPRRRRAIR